jgi:hypothetical protein
MAVLLLLDRRQVLESIGTPLLHCILRRNRPSINRRLLALVVVLSTVD